MSGSAAQPTKPYATKWQCTLLVEGCCFRFSSRVPPVGCMTNSYNIALVSALWLACAETRMFFFQACRCVNSILSLVSVFVRASRSVRLVDIYFLVAGVFIAPTIPHPTPSTPSPFFLASLGVRPGIPPQKSSRPQ